MSGRALLSAGAGFCGSVRWCRRGDRGAGAGPVGRQRRVGHRDRALVDLLDSLNIPNEKQVSLIHLVNLQFIFCQSVLGKFKNLSLLALRSKVLTALFGVPYLSLQVFDYLSISSLEKDHLVWDNSHLQESQCLSLRSWEAFNNIVCLLRLVRVDDALQEFNHDFILNI